MSENQTSELPSIPSKLIRLALQDLKKCIVEGVRVNMRTWYWNGPSTESCAVCLAGAVMRHSLVLPEKKRGCLEINPEDFDDTNFNKLCALNYFRSGYISMGVFKLGRSIPEKLSPGRRMPEYKDEEPEPFFSAMEQLANDLEEHEL